MTTGVTAAGAGLADLPVDGFTAGDLSAEVTAAVGEAGDG
jgi:hypothetical protein